jgi:hypothetical protein
MSDAEKVRLGVLYIHAMRLVEIPPVFRPPPGSFWDAMRQAWHNWSALHHERLVVERRLAALDAENIRKEKAERMSRQFEEAERQRRESEKATEGRRLRRSQGGWKLALAAREVTVEG